MKNGYANKFLILLLLLCMSAQLRAEVTERIIKGRVTSSDGELLPGVNVVIKGSETGTITDMDGKYSIAVPEKNVTLVFSYIGFMSEEIEITNQTVVDVVLVPSIKTLTDVVVVAYGKVKKSDLTGSVASVRADELKTTATASFDQALQGRAAGVVVTQTSGQPGGQASIRIRGISSIDAGNEPLYVIDGMLVSTDNLVGTFTQGPRISPLASLNPNDIESMEILKDASATALYGSRATNGVILITTKRGKEGQGSINFETSYGMQQIANKLDVLNAEEFGTFYNQVMANSGQPPKFIPEALGEGTDWQNEIFRTAPMYNAQLTFSGGDKTTSYAVGVGYFNQEGIIINSSFDRYNFRANLDRNVSKKLKVGNSLSYSYITNNGQFTGSQGTFSPTIVGQAILFNPYLPVYNPADVQHHGYTFQNDGNIAIGNPVAEARHTENRSYSSRILGNVYARYEIVKGLEFKSTLGIDNMNAKDNNYTPNWIKRSEDLGIISQGTSSFLTWLNENTLTYIREFNRNHTIDFLIGSSIQKSRSESLNAYIFRVNDGRTSYHNLGVGEEPQRPGNSEDQWQMLSYLGRLNYKFKDKYLLTLTGRWDGSSKFGENHKFGFFPSIAFAWKVYEEEFMKNLDFISELKLRTSYGRLGNQAIPSYKSLPLVTRFGEGNFNYGNSYAVYYGYQPAIMENPDLKWETTDQLDLGLDFSILNGKISFTADFYNKNTRDLLLDTRISEVTGFSSIWKNIGNIRNNGFDLDVRTINLDRGLQWRSTINFSMNRNKVTRLSSGTDVQLGYGLILREGEPMGTFYGYVFDGIFQSDEEAASSPVLDGQQTNGPNPNVRAKAGDRKYKDLSGANGVPDGKIDQYDRTIIGNALPDFTYGITNEFSYKSLTLSIFIQGSQGNDMYNANNIDLENMTGLNNVHGDFGRNYWTPENRSNKYPRPVATSLDASTFSSRLIEDASYIRVKNLTLGWNLPSGWINRIRVKNLRLFFSATNLLTFTKYSGFDPEGNTFGTSTKYFGVDQWGYPQSRTFTVGCNMGF